MKSPPTTIQYLNELLPINEDSKKDLNKAFHFGPGQAFICGKLSNNKLKEIRGYPFGRTN
jgi:hypothetical protein